MSINANIAEFINMPINDRLRFAYWSKLYHKKFVSTECPRITFLKWLDTISVPIENRITIGVRERKKFTLKLTQ